MLRSRMQSQNIYPFVRLTDMLRYRAKTAKRRPIFKMLSQPVSPAILVFSIYFLNG